MLNSLDSCKKCKRIHHNLVCLSKIYTTYLNKPIHGSGNTLSPLCIVGLAPGLHGANRTGEVFKGDFSGEILHKCLKLSGFIDKDHINYPYITNAVKCYPPANKPLSSEIKNCSKFLSEELDILCNLKVIVALGKLAHDSVLRVYGASLAKYKFIHNHTHQINNRILLLDSYHCSKININTKKLTTNMLRDVFLQTKKILS